MVNDVMLTQKDHENVCQLLQQLIEFSQHEDRLNNLSDPMKYPGEGFITNKLKLIKEVLENGSE